MTQLPHDGYYYLRFAGQFSGEFLKGNFNDWEAQQDYLRYHHLSHDYTISSIIDQRMAYCATSLQFI